MALYSGFYLSPFRVPLPDICMIMFAQKNSVSIKLNFLLVMVRSQVQLPITSHVADGGELSIHRSLLAHPIHDGVHLIDDGFMRLSVNCCYVVFICKLLLCCKDSLIGI